jgi:hypothetical protein
MSQVRAKKATKRLDLTDLKACLKDGRRWCAMAIVTKAKGQASHYELHQEDGIITDVMVDVITMPDGLDLTCRLSACAGGPGAGLWRVPDVDEEVVVMLPDGQIDFMPIIVGVLPARSVPARVSHERTILVAPDAIEITVTNGDATLEASGNVYLGERNATHAAARGDSLQASLNSLISAFNSHFHGTNVTVGPTTPPISSQPPNPSPPPGFLAPIPAVPHAASPASDLSPNVKVK